MFIIKYSLSIGIPINAFCLTLILTVTNIIHSSDTIAMTQQKSFIFALQTK